MSDDLFELYVDMLLAKWEEEVARAIILSYLAQWEALEAVCETLRAQRRR